MITIERKKLKQILEALTYCEALNKDVEQQKMQAITALNEALSQTAQEPVAWAVVGEGKFGLYEIGRETETNPSVCKYWANRGYSLVPLYTTLPAAQPAQEPVADIERNCNDCKHNGFGLIDGGCGTCHARINFAPIQPAQEPVAQWQKRHHLWTEGAWENAEEHDAKQWRDKAQGWEIRALYTTPQPQEPRNFCPRCGKRTADLTVIHTCTPPKGGHQ